MTLYGFFSISIFDPYETVDIEKKIKKNRDRIHKETKEISREKKGNWKMEKKKNRKYNNTKNRKKKKWINIEQKKKIVIVIGVNWA